MAEDQRTEEEVLEALIQSVLKEKEALAGRVNALGDATERARLLALNDTLEAMQSRLIDLRTRLPLETDEARRAFASTLALEDRMFEAVLGRPAIKNSLHGEQLSFVNRLLFNTPGGKRFTQDSPILPSVLSSYALAPRQQVELILTLKGNESAGRAAKRLRQMIAAYRKKLGNGTISLGIPLTERKSPRISYIPGQIAVRLYFDEMMRVVLPLTPWWHETYDELNRLGRKFSLSTNPAINSADWYAFPMPDPKGLRERDMYEALMEMRREIDPSSELILEQEKDLLHASLSKEDREQIEGELKSRRKYIQQFPQDVSWFVRVAGLIADCFINDTRLLVQPDGLSAILQRDFVARRDEANSSVIETGPDRETRIGYEALTPEEAFDNRRGIATSFLKLYAGWLSEEIQKKLQKKQRIDLDSNDRFPTERMIWRITKNRPVHLASAAMNESAMTVKADAARRLFDVSCGSITWAILDSGIDGSHPAFCNSSEAHENDIMSRIRSDEYDKADAKFRKARAKIMRRKDTPERQAEIDELTDQHSQHRQDIKRNRPEFALEDLDSRVSKTLDFTELRSILENDFEEEEDGVAPETIARLKRRRQTLIERLQSRISDNGKASPADKKRARSTVNDLSERVRKGLELNWRDLEDAIVLNNPEKPTNDHGTHVAGILGADWIEDFENEQELPLHARTRKLIGMCPDINLIDVRVFKEDGLTDEFELLAAIQFLRWMNERAGAMEVHGANLSLSLLHEVQHFACGQTPICDECNEASALGMVMVAAAGNRGFTQESEQPIDTNNHYQSISVTDPGNADSVITVGATHRKRPHEYGVSYFSSRGPTGDGRMKPDIVAPGEKIQGPTPDERMEVKDGTSMAAPHVSGVAAMLMARHTELIGKPGRIKDILCSTATDLGRERYFQGHGLVDALRALQSV